MCHTCLVSGSEDGPCVPKLHEEPNDAIVLYIISIVYRHAICGPHWCHFIVHDLP